jgi:hypothetical protein
LQAAVGQLLEEDKTNRSPQRGQRNRISADHVTPPTQHVGGRQAAL